MKNIKFALITGLIFFMSCRIDQNFEKEGWNEFKPNSEFFPSPQRDKMLKDLTENHKLVGLTIAELRKQVGEPDFYNRNLIGYTIIADYAYSIDTAVHTKNLYLTLSGDSVINSFKVEEHEK
ncbi:MAG: hypothetical protein HY305_02225 [Sphingobacteriales bacterium]|nr:hypothetical protein [Sphingobacteriales bacterium]